MPRGIVEVEVELLHHRLRWCFLLITGGFKNPLLQGGELLGISSFSGELAQQGFFQAGEKGAGFGLVEESGEEEISRVFD